MKFKILIIYFLTCCGSIFAQPHLWKEVLRLGNEEQRQQIYGGSILDSNSVAVIFENTDDLDIKKTISGVAITNDGGKNWDFLATNIALPNTKNTATTNVVDYVSKKDIFVGCNYNYMLITNDGGINWRVTSLPRFCTGTGVILEEISLLSMYDKNIGIALADSEVFNTNTHLYATTDGWKTFNEIKIPEEYYVAQRVTGRYNGFIKCFGKNNFLCKILDKKTSKQEFIGRTTDGGETWQIIKNPLGLNIPMDSIRGYNMSFKDSLTGWCLGHFLPKNILRDTTRGFLSKTTDGGATWNFIERINMPIDPDTINKNRNTGYSGFYKLDDQSLQVATPLSSRLGKDGKWVIDTAQIYLYWTKIYFEKRFGAPNIFMRVNENVIIKDFGEYTPTNIVEYGKAINVSLFPNPAKSIVNMRLTEELSNNADLGLYDNIGKKVLSKIIPKGTDNFQIDVSNLPNGIYNAVIRNGEKTTTQEVVVAR